jgi:hypothetical protein
VHIATIFNVSRQDMVLNVCLLNIDYIVSLGTLRSLSSLSCLFSASTTCASLNTVHYCCPFISQNHHWLFKNSCFHRFYNYLIECWFSQLIFKIPWLLLNLKALSHLIPLSRQQTFFILKLLSLFLNYVCRLVTII